MKLIDKIRKAIDVVRVRIYAGRICGSTYKVFCMLDNAGCINQIEDNTKAIIEFIDECFEDAKKMYPDKNDSEWKQIKFALKPVMIFRNKLEKLIEA